jgi:hypothetical protein
MHASREKPGETLHRPSVLELTAKLRGWFSDNVGELISSQTRLK